MIDAELGVLGGSQVGGAVEGRDQQETRRGGAPKPG